MNSQGNGAPLVYHVSMSEQIREAIKQRHREAAQTGKGDRFLATLKRIYERLRADPLQFGEALFRLPALKLLVCQAALAFLVIDFAVHEEQPLVFIRGLKVLD